MPVAPFEPSIPATDYRRRARRLRARFAGRPALLQDALEVLARETDGNARQVGPAVGRGFAAGVADRLRAGPFTYSDRHALLATGQRLGLDRFQANLIVAAQQHAAVPGRRTATARVAIPRPPRRRSAVAIGVGLQVAITAAAVWAWTA